MSSQGSNYFHVNLLKFFKGSIFLETEFDSSGLLKDTSW